LTLSVAVFEATMRVKSM